MPGIMFAIDLHVFSTASKPRFCDRAEITAVRADPIEFSTAS